MSCLWMVQPEDRQNLLVLLAPETGRSHGSRCKELVCVGGGSYWFPKLIRNPCGNTSRIMERDEKKTR